jgi:choice-of-anchor A domain-containing protein
VFLSGAFSDSGSDVEGGLVAGGLITVPDWFAVMQGPAGEPLSAFGTNQASFVSTMGFTDPSHHMSDDGGNWYMVTGGGNVTNNGHGGTALTTNPLTISTQMTQYQSTSNYVSGLADTAGDSCTNSGTTTTCTISKSGLNVLNVGGTTGYSASWFTTGNTVLINGVSSAQWAVLDFEGSGPFTVTGNIRIDGDYSNGTPGTSVGTYAQYVLYNFRDATSVTIDERGFIGSILAPQAAVTDNAGGQFDGQLVAASFSSANTEFHNFLFEGSLTPEPAPVAFVGAGLALLFYFRKRCRQ